MKHKYTIAWCVWAAVGLIIEIAALRDKRKGDTLSEHIWTLVRIPVIWWTTAGLLIWAVIHFLGQGKLDDFFIAKKKDIKHARS